MFGGFLVNGEDGKELFFCIELFFVDWEDVSFVVEIFGVLELFNDMVVCVVG